MVKSIFRQFSTGFPLARVDDRQPNPPLPEHLDEVAAEYGLNRADLVREDFVTDPRADTNVIFPPVLPDTRSEGRKIIDRIRTEQADPNVELASLAEIRAALGALIAGE